MAFDTNMQGAITLSPLVDYETAIVHETVCGLRLLLARSADQARTPQIVVQVGMTMAQATSLARDLQKMIDPMPSQQVTNPLLSRPRSGKTFS